MVHPVEPWAVPEPRLDPDRSAAAASVLALANGWVGVRGVLEELAGPSDDDDAGPGPGTLMAAAHDDVPLSYAEPAFGYPTHSERLVPVPDAWAVQLLVDGTPLDARTASRHERRLDLRRGVLEREVAWAAPSGGRVAVSTRRLVSLARRELVVTRYTVRALSPVRVELRPFPCCGAAPGAAPVPETDPDRPLLEPEHCRHTGERSATVHRAARSGVRVAVVGEHRVSADVAVARETADHRTSLVADLSEGGELTLLGVTAYVADDDAAPSDLLDRAAAVLDDDGVRGASWEDLLAEHAAVLADAWSAGDVEIEGDDAVQQAVRFALLHVVMAAARADGVGIRAKGLTGDGYDGHTFWDADTYLRPVLDHVLPAGSRAHLRWRHATLPAARDRAAELGLPGAAFPWRTVTGAESSGYWPAGTAAVHISADVADAAVRHAVATGDEDFERDVARELCVEAARFLLALGRWDHHDETFHIDGVTGPDEYSALMDDNAFTNVVARRVLRLAARLATRWPRVAPDVAPVEVAAWTRAADALVVPYDHELGVTQQASGFTRLAPWDFDAWPTDDYPLHSHAHYSQLYRRQVLKQADVVAAAWLVPEAFTPEQKRRDFDHYEPLTVRDSSLSAPPQAVVAAEVGHLDLAWAYTRETALVDLHDDGRPTEDGVHVAAHAGAWIALVAGFGGLREHDGGLHLRPVLPPALTRLAFGLRRGDSAVRVDVGRTEVTYRLTAGPGLELTHDGDPVKLTAAEPVATRPTVTMPPTVAPPQPPGREPFRHP